MADEKVRILITHDRNVNGGNQIFGKGAEYEVAEPVARGLIAEGKAKLLKGKLKKDPVAEAGRMTNQEFLTFVQRNAAEIFTMMQQEADKVNNSPGADVTAGTASGGTVNETDSETSEDDANASDKDTGAGEGNEAGNESKEDEIPEDFPGREVLAKNGITTMSAIPRDKEELMKLDQMTGRVANQIGVKLGE
jgi:hypothetical protein